VGTLAPTLRREKRHWHHNKNTARDKLSSIPLSEEYFWSSRRKNNSKH
jgi:hypothetical protein